MMTARQARRLIGICAILAALHPAATALAQKTTERYIPIGQSPGVSHTLTEVAKIEAADGGRRSLTITTPSGRLAVEVPPNAPIWIDRSKLRQTSLVGGFGDLVPGRTVEVRFANPDRKRTAVWVKVAP